MGGDRGGRGEEPGTCPWKVTSCHLLQRRKTGTNFPGEAIPLPPPPAPVGVVWIRTHMSDGGLLFFI